MMNSEAFLTPIIITVGWMTVSENPHPAQKFLLLGLLFCQLVFQLQEWFFPGLLPLSL